MATFYRHVSSKSFPSLVYLKSEAGEISGERVVIQQIETTLVLEHRLEVHVEFVAAISRQRGDPPGLAPRHTFLRNSPAAQRA